MPRVVLRGEDGAVPIGHLGSDDIASFAEARGLPVDFLKSMGLHISPPDGERPYWIAIPYPHLTGLWQTRYRNPGVDGPKYWAAPGSGTHLYNPLRLGPNADVVWFTEGEIDCLTLVYLGLPAIGIPGATIGARFHKSWKTLYDEAEVVVAFDNDEAGQGAAEKLAAAFAPHSHLFVPPDGMDINEWWIEDGPGLTSTAKGFAAQEGLI